MGYQPRSFKDVLEDVRYARRWYAELGVSTSRTRLEALEDRLATFEFDRTSLPQEAIVRKWSNPETYYAFTDGVAFGMIARELRKVGPNLFPKKKLHTIIEGPLSAADEQPGSANVNARNIFAELELAAYLSQCGIEPAGFNDLQVDFEGTRYHIECKRLLSKSAVVDNIRRAYEQLQRTMTADADRGMIALVVDRVMDLEGNILRLAPGDNPTPLAEGIALSFQEEFGRPWHVFVDPRIVAMIVVCRFLVHTIEHNVIGPAYYVVIVNLASPAALQRVDQDRLIRLAEKLRSGAGPNE